MPQYVLLLYANPADPEEQAERERELPVWAELNQSLQDAGLLVAAERLQDGDSATTVRVRDGETEITDGPYAVTKEFLAGYYVLDCRDLDEVLKHAARIPLARYGSVEIRPVMEGYELLARHEAATAEQ